MTTAAKRVPSIGLWFSEGWPLRLGFVVLAIPTFIGLASQTWTHDDGTQGPIVLGTGGWLLWRELPLLRRTGVPDTSVLTSVLLALALVSYVAGSVVDYMTVEAGGLYAAGLALLNARFGLRALRAVWFPLVYFAFAVPLPGLVLAQMTSPLKHFAAFVSTQSLSAAGFPVARQGVTIIVAQYQLLVEDACSGMNSLMGLTAIGLLYVYLTRRASAAYAALLTCLVIPIAVASNILRIVTLILITYFFGDQVGQSFIHMAAGLFLFATALLLVFAIDRGLYPLYARITSRRG
jgi:exosortase